MAKVPLTIDKNYCSDWGVWHGIRELLQNAKDAEDYEDRPMEVTHYPRTNRLEIISRGVYVNPANLLVLGKSGKGDGRQRGKFGEGFVLGVLALTRKGCEVKFRNDHLSWTVGFEEPDAGHPLEGNTLLTFRSRELAAEEPDFRVEIDGSTTEAWNVLRSKALFLSPPKESEVIKTDNGLMLLDPARKGEVYARGLYVRTFNDLSVGYDIHQVALDRDRQMINEFDLHWALSKMWTQACETHPILAAPRVYEMAKADAPDARQLKYHADEKLLKSMREHFEGENGKDAVPVTSNQEAREVTSAGGKPQMVSGIMKDLLEKGGLSIENAKKQLESVVSKRWAPADIQCGPDAGPDAYARMCRLEEIFPQMVVVTFKSDAPACHLIDEGKTIGVDRRLLDVPLRESIPKVLAAEARRVSVPPLDVLVAHVAGEPLQSTSASQDPEF